LLVIHIYDGCALSQSITHFLTHCIQDIWNACIFTAYAALALHVVIVLFGAPFIECVIVYASAVTLPFVTTCSLTDARAHSRYVPHTALLALLLAVYAIFPPAYVLGPPRLGIPLLSTSACIAVVQNDLWVRIFAERE